MTTKDDLHHLVDELDEAAAREALVLLQDLRLPRVLREARIDDELETDEERWHRVNVHGQGVPHLRMTTKGRHLARSWTGVKPYKAPPPGTLKEWHWRALAKAYAAGDEGLEGEYGVYAHISERTWQRLLEYKWGALVDERGTGEYRDLRQVRRMYITADGRALYHDQWAALSRALR